MIPKPQNTFCCPECGTSEVYKVVHHHEWMYTADGDIIFGETIIDYCPVRFGKYDTPEPGNYECVEGHQFVNNSFSE